LRQVVMTSDVDESRCQHPALIPGVCGRRR